MTTLQQVELGVLGPLQVRQYGLPVAIPGAKPRAILTMLGLHGGSVVSADTLVELLWGDDPPRTAAKALQTHISSLRRTLGDGFVLTEGTGWILRTSEIDATRYTAAARLGRDAVAAGDTSQAVARFDEALSLWRGTPELPDGSRGVSEKTRWFEGHASLVEDRADAMLATGRAAEIIGDLEAAVGDAPLRERRWGQLMLALYRAGRQGEALGAYQRARSLLADELGVDPGPDLRRLEAAIVAQDTALEIPAAQQLSAVTRAVTFLLTDIEGSTATWEADADAMAIALARHDEIVEQVVTSRGGRLVKTRGEGDATFSVFDRPSAAAAAAIELQEAIHHEQWTLAEPMRIRIALHTGEVEFRDGDYFGRAVNRAARLRSLADGGQILCSGATAELVIDTLRDDVLLVDLGTRQLKNLARPEHVFELRPENADDSRTETPEAPIERPALPTVLAGTGPFVGRVQELERLLSSWQTTLDAGTRAVLISGEPGVGKTRLAGEWSRLAYEQGAVVLYGRCDEDLGAPYQPFAEALRSLVPCVGSKRLRGLRGVEALLPMIPGLADELPDLAAPARADADTERYALFDAVVALLGTASASAPVVLVLDDLHWAAKPTLLLLRHLLRFGEHARVQIVGTYRSTDLDRTHPLAAMLADLHRDGSAHRLALSGLDAEDVTAYVAEAGYDDEELARALASVTGGNPFFLIEALRHVDESGGRWDPSTLPQGVREAVSRRLSRLPAETNKALAAAAVVGSRFALDLVERVVDQDLVDAFDEACKAGILIEEHGGHYRFNHALVRQSLLAELASVRRMRLHQRIAATLEAEPGADDELLAELAYHYFECAWAGNAAKAVDYCRRAADQAMARLAYEGAADLYDRAVHALDELDEELPDREDLQAELLIARCEALLAAGDVVSATGTVAQLQQAAGDSARLAAWGTCFDGQLSMLTDPERLDEIESAVGAAAEKLAGLDDAAGEAKAHTVRAGCLARLGRIGDCETALDQALTAARRAREHRRVNNVLANAPLAALWGPNPVPRAGGRCLDVVRLLRITTGSPVVEATSTRCQGVLDAFRGRAAAGRQLIDSARRSLTELGMRHALLEVEQFAGIVELVAEDPAAAEAHLRRAYNGFRRMGIDADTADTAALLARACLALDREDEADELCSESERLAGHALKASIAWRTVRAQLLARRGSHDEARRVAEEAVSVAERTDILVDHGDACLALATVLRIAGDSAGATAAAEQAVGLYERKGAAALAEIARRLLGAEPPAAPAMPEGPQVELDNDCWRVAKRAMAAINREALEEAEQLWAPDVLLESRRKIVGFTTADLPPGEWYARRVLQVGGVRVSQVVIAIRGERLALTRTAISTTDASPGAARDEFLRVFGIDKEGRIALEVWFDVDDMDAALAELDAAYARFGEQRPRTPLENAASRAEDQLHGLFAESRWDEIDALLTDDVRVEERRRAIRLASDDRATLSAEIRVIADLGVKNMTSEVLAIRGERLVLSRVRFTGRDQRPDGFHTELLRIGEIGGDGRFVAIVTFDLDDFDAAIAEVDARYLAGEAAAHSHRWSAIAEIYAGLNRHELPATTPDWVNVDHRHVTTIAAGDLIANLRAAWDLTPRVSIYIEAVHRLSDLGTVVTHSLSGTSQEGFFAEWRMVDLLTFDGDVMNRSELFDEVDIGAAIARFEELCRPAQQLENAASRVIEDYLAHFTTRDWEAMAVALADDFWADDRRRVVNTGVRSGRDTEIANMQAIAEVGCAGISTTPTATRGERLVLACDSFMAGDSSEPFHGEMVDVVEIDSEERITAIVSFDLDDIDAAYAELDARYLAGEAKAYARTWSVVAGAYASLNSGELPATTAAWVMVDHRRGLKFASDDSDALVRTVWEITPDNGTHIEAVLELSNIGAVVVQTAHGTSQDGFSTEWREIIIVTVEGDLASRCEVFDETDLDAALARFEEISRPALQLNNAANQVLVRYLSHFLTRDWDAMAQALADNVSADDRRHVVNGGVRHGRESEIVSVKAFAEIGCTEITTTPIAIRGERLVLSNHTFTAPDWPGLDIEVVDVVEINADNQIVAAITFDADDLDAAFAELDARYLAGEAAPCAQSWHAVIDAAGELNRHEMAPTLGRLAYVDHRRIPFTPGDYGRAIEDLWDLVPDARYRVTGVHALNARGAVFTLLIEGTDTHGNELQWVRVCSWSFEQARVDVYEEDDLDAALARFEELRPRERQLENAASRMHKRTFDCFADRDWDVMAELLADDVCIDDRRRVVNTEIQRGRDAAIMQWQATADVGVTKATSVVIATRGERLVLSRDRISGTDQGPEAFYVEVLHVVEINSDEQTVARIVFDLADIDEAFEELDARYLAGDAAVHSTTWSVVTRAYAALNRRELFATTPDWTNSDHRRAIAFEPGELISWIRASWDLAPDIHLHIEAVHRLTSNGAVVTHTGNATSQEGFNAEWRVVTLVTIDGDLLNRSELFDEEDLDAALSRFDELSRPKHQLENAATRLNERFEAYFATRDWAAMAETLAEDFSNDDRRRVVNAGNRRGRDAETVNLRALVDLGVKNMMSIVMATRGDGLTLTRTRLSGSDERPENYLAEVLQIVQIDADDRYLAIVMFDIDDIDAAFAELETRYRAGEAAASAHTWSLVAGAYAALNRHEFPATKPDWVNIDNRRGTGFAAGDMTQFLRAAWELVAQDKRHIEAVHRLTNTGAVVTRVATATTHEGFDAEWREIDIVTFDGDLISRCELFDEDDLDTALARFDDLDRPAPRLENAASRMYDRFNAYLAAHDWDAMAAMVTDDACNDDRRRVVSGGIQRGRDALIANLRAVIDVGAKNFESIVVAIRGERLALTHSHVSGGSERGEAFGLEMLTIIEIATDNRIATGINFDLEDIDAAFAELETRYLAGEAAVHAHTWSRIAEAYAGFNRRELPATSPDWTNIDHRSVTAFAPGELPAFTRATWQTTPDIRIYVEAVHRLTDLGAVVATTTRGTSLEGFDAESREIGIMTVEGELISRTELFDEGDLNVALTTFEQLSRPAPQLENAASRTYDRFNASLAARDWDAIAEMVTDDVCNDDRRRVVNAGIRRGRDAQVANFRAIVDVGVRNFESVAIATRGERLALTRTRASVSGKRGEAFGLEMLTIVEIDTDNRITTGITFDAEDILAAFEELDTRYLADEAARHAHTWTVIAQGYAAASRGELAATAADVVNIDHRHLGMIESGKLIPYLRETFDELANINTYVEAVHQLTDLGTVVTHVGAGTSKEGFDAEWRAINLLIVDGDLCTRSEMFDEADLDAALARFDELSHPAPPLENAASQVTERFWALFASRDFDVMAEILADETSSDDRRRVVGSGILHGREASIADLRAIAGVGAENFAPTVIATRGERLVLGRFRVTGAEAQSEAFYIEMLGVVEIDSDNRIVARVAFDPDDIDAAFAELDGRYLAGEAAAHALTWSATKGVYAAFNRRELPPTTPDWENIDHRRGTAFAPGDVIPYIRSAWDVAPDINIYIQVVHRLNNLGAVVTFAAHGTSEYGFDAEWREITALTFDIDLLNRCEVFDEADIDAACARFDELSRPVPQVENAASRVTERYFAHFTAHNWAAMAETVAVDIFADDRRPVVGIGVLRGREAIIAENQTIADVGATKVTHNVIATRGNRLALSHVSFLIDEQQQDPYQVELVGVIEINADSQIATRIVFEPDDIDAAFEELDARYLAGEAAVHGHTWSRIAEVYATFNRHEHPATTPDWVTIDHRQLATWESADPSADIRSIWDLTPDLRISMEAVHRLSDLGVVVTHVATATSREGFDAEWRIIFIFAVEGDVISRCEMFDEADIDAALVRFDELSRPMPQLENAASQVDERYRACFAARDWEAMAETMAPEICTDDRRPLVGTGIRRGRDAAIAHAGATADVGVQHITSTVIATRGERLILRRARFSGRDQGPEAFHTETLSIIEVNADNQIIAAVQFDLDDIDAALKELDARYLAGEADAHAHTWSLITRTFVALNKHELPTTTPDWSHIDHRPIATYEVTDLAAYLRATWDLTPERGAWNLARRLRSRMAGDQPHHLRGRQDQPGRGFRRGRPRRRHREIRRARFASTSTCERRDPDLGPFHRCIKPPRRRRCRRAHCCRWPIGRPPEGPACRDGGTRAAKSVSRAVVHRAEQLAIGDGAHCHQGISSFAVSRKIPRHRRYRQGGHRRGPHCHRGRHR
jgi:class 3 adenylate cyclase